MNKSQSLGTSFKNAAVIMLWLLATCLWFLALVISAEKLQASSGVQWLGALGLSVCWLVSYALVPRWIVHLPGVIGYAIWNGIFMALNPSRFPGVSRAEMGVWIAIWVVVVAGLIYLSFSPSRRTKSAPPLPRLARGLLAPVPMLVLAPAVPGVHLGMWGAVMLTLVGVPALQKYWQSRKPSRRGIVGRRSTSQPKQPHFEDQPDR